MREEFRKRRDVLVEGLRDMGIELVRPNGAFYVFPDVGDGDAATSRLMNAGVITVPGSAFGAHGARHIRISYAAAIENIKEALERMKDIL